MAGLKPAMTALEIRGIPTVVMAGRKRVFALKTRPSTSFLLEYKYA